MMVVTLSEPIYEYVKGQGWVASLPAAGWGGEVIDTGIRVHNGVSYRVSIVKRKVEGMARAPEYNVKKVADLRWWDEFEGIPAGYGPVTEHQEHVVITVKL